MNDFLKRMLGTTAVYSPPREGGSANFEEELGEQFEDTNDDNDSDESGSDDNDDGSNDDDTKSSVKSKSADEELEDRIDKDILDATAKGKDKGKKDEENNRGKRTAREDNRNSGKNYNGKQSKEQYTADLQRFSRSHVSEDKHGNLVDPKTGAIVATAGRERFFFEQARNGRVAMDKAQQRIEQIVALGRQFETKVNAYEAMNKSGLQFEEQNEAIQLYKSYKENPEAALKYILTEAQANGINLEKVLGKGNTNIDLGAIKSLISKELKPIIEPMQARTAKEQRDAAAEQQAQTFVDNFYREFPDAEVHDSMIGELITAGMSPHQAYIKLKEFALKNDFDWSRDLRVQQAERKNGGGGRQQNNGQRRPLPNGRNPRTFETKQRDNNASLGAFASADDIVREAMQEAGYSIN